MADYAPVFAVDVPWADYLEQIHTVNIENGITAIGDYAFSDCPPDKYEEGSDWR